MNKITNIFFSFFIVVLLTQCATNPVTGKKELQLISETQEISIGADNYLPTQQSQGGIYNVDPQLTDYLNSIGMKLARASDRPKLPYEFVVLNNSVPNAWALPGGKIAVNRGLLLELKNEAELAAVLGHEIVHTAARHGAKSMERNILLSAGIAGVAIAIGDSDYANLAVGAAALGSQLIATKYSRSAELEADYYGIQYMVKSGYSPEAAIELQQTFVKLSHGRDTHWLEGLFASHPPSQERVEANRRTAKKIHTKGRLGEQEFQSRIANLIKTKPAYDAMDQARTALRKKDTDKALSFINKAIKIEPREALFYGIKGDIYRHNKQLLEAEKLYTQAVNKNNQFFVFYLQRGLLREKLHKPQGAKFDLNKSLEFLPTAPAYYALGNIALTENDPAAAKDYYAKAAANRGELGKKAATSLAKLEINENPQKYLNVAFLKTLTGQLAITIKNQSLVSVKEIELQLKLQSRTGSVLAKEKLLYRHILRPGENKQLATRILPLPTDTQKLQADITKVVVVE